MVWKILHYIKDYCINCSLAGLGYIADQRLHLVERIFWIVCIILSALGSYHLISQYRRDFDSKAVSIAYQSLPPYQKIKFPSVAVCDLYNQKAPAKFESFVESLGPKYNFEIESIVKDIIYPAEYFEHTMKKTCEKQNRCKNCSKCPTGGFRQIVENNSYDCSEIFNECSLADKHFDCCKHFLPMITPFGKCFLLNSLQNNKPGKKSWLNTMIDPATEVARMNISCLRHFKLFVLNEEDLPNYALPFTSTIVKGSSTTKIFQLYMENMVNDPDVRDVSPQSRKCRFPDETLPNTAYKSYSYSSCLADCTRVHQLKACNCSTYYLMPKAKSSVPECGYEGVVCLDAIKMSKPNALRLLPWFDSKYTCNCMHSCMENDFQKIYESLSSGETEALSTYNITVFIPNLPTVRYRRQALRTRLDIVVTIGGIMGLFLGASVLSFIEFIYYFTLRIYNTPKRNERRADRH